MTDHMPPAARAEFQQLYRRFSEFEAETSELMEQLGKDIDESRELLRLSEALLRDARRREEVLRAYIERHACEEHGHAADNVAAALDDLLEEGRGGSEVKESGKSDGRGVIFIPPPGGGGVARDDD